MKTEKGVARRIKKRRIKKSRKKKRRKKSKEEAEEYKSKKPRGESTSYTFSAVRKSRKS